MKSGYLQINLSDLINRLGEDKTKLILSKYLCPSNSDVEEFLKIKSIEFNKQGIAITYLVFASYKGKPVFVGYYTLANKYISTDTKYLSRTQRKRISKFAKYDRIQKAYCMPIPLIAQLGKNYQNNSNKLIMGDELLYLALERVEQIHKMLGGRYVYLECENCTRLTEFYESNGLVKFGERELDSDESGMNEGKCFIQYLRRIQLN